MRFGAVSCASYWSVVAWDGMRKLAARNDLDLVLHAGDHVYDYPDEDEWVRARNGVFDERDVDFRRWRTLAEVRRRYALYYADPDFLALHQQHPLFVLWDNHDLSTGDDNQPVPEADVIKAFWEWTPTRPPKGSSLWPAGTDQDYVYRALPYGPLADVSCIDVRHIATEAERTAGHVLGAAQLDWLLTTLRASKAAGTAWRVVVNGYPFGQFQVGAPVTVPGVPDISQVIYGGWDDYPAERARIVTALRTAGVLDNLVITGDSHGNIVWDVTEDQTLPAYRRTDGRSATGAVQSIGVEMQCSSLGRGGATETLAGTAYRAAHDMTPPYADRAGFAPYLAAAPAGSAALSAAVVAGNPAMQYFEWDSHGYGIVHLTATQATLEFWKQPIRTSDDTDTLFAQFTVPRRAQHPTPVLVPAATSGTRVSAPAPAAVTDAPPPASLPETPLPVGLVAAGALVAAVAAVRVRSTRSTRAAAPTRAATAGETP